MSGVMREVGGDFLAVSAPAEEMLAPKMYVRPWSGLEMDERACK